MAKLTQRSATLRNSFAFGIVVKMRSCLMSDVTMFLIRKRRREQERGGATLMHTCARDNGRTTTPSTPVHAPNEHT